VQQAGVSDELDLIQLEIAAFRENRAVFGDTLQMRGRVLVAVFGGDRQSSDRVEVRLADLLACGAHALDRRAQFGGSLVDDVLQLALMPLDGVLRRLHLQHAERAHSKFKAIDRLVYVVVGAAFHRPKTVVHRARRGCGDNRHVVKSRVGAYMHRDREPVDIRHHQVQNDKVNVARQSIQRLAARPRPHDPVSVRRQHGFEEIEVDIVVIDDQDCCGIEHMSPLAAEFRLGSLRSVESVPNPGNETARVDRLRDVSAAAGGARRLLVDDKSVRGHGDDGNVLCTRIRFDEPGRLDAVHLGQSDIHHNDIRLNIAAQSNGLFTRACFDTVYADNREQIDNQFAVANVVVDDKRRFVRVIHGFPGP
jgi:hypothetical protein